jgi:hypothetical protein
MLVKYVLSDGVSQGKSKQMTDFIAWLSRCHNMIYLTEKLYRFFSSTFYGLEIDSNKKDQKIANLNFLIFHPTLVHYFVCAKYDHI